MIHRAGGQHAARLWETALIASLLAIAGFAWIWTNRLAGAHMGAHMGMETPSGGSMSPMSPGEDAHFAGAIGLYMLAWIIMMVAMMLPAVLPVVVTFDRWVRKARQPKWQTALFVGGYFVVWGGLGLMFYAAAALAQPLLPSGNGMLRWLGVLWLLAGIYQLTPLKHACLRQCRSPLGFVAEHSEQLTRGGIAAGKVGAKHGLACVGCCWGLMLVLALLGMASVAWMAAVAAVIFLEKAVPARYGVSVAVAVLLLSGGVALLVSPLIWSMAA